MPNAQWENDAVNQLQGGQGGQEIKSPLALILLRAATMSFTIQFLAQNLFLNTHLLNQTVSGKAGGFMPSKKEVESLGGLVLPAVFLSTDCPDFTLPGVAMSKDHSLHCCLNSLHLGIWCVIFKIYF